MSIFDRAKNVISSNVGAVMSSLRDGDATAKQQEALRAALAAEKSMRQHCDELAGESERWAKRAELALAAGDDELARAALVKKQEFERDLARATRALAEASQLVEKVRSELGVATPASDADSVIARMEAKVAALESASSTTNTPYSRITSDATDPVRYRVK